MTVPNRITNPKDRELFHKDQRPTEAGSCNSSGSSYRLAALPPCDLNHTTETNGVKTTAREMVRQTLAGQSVSRWVAGPLAVHYCAGLAGISLQDYTMNARHLADSVIRYYERFHPDAVWLSADTWVLAEAMGASVAFPGPQQPLAGSGRPCVQSRDDIDRIPPPYLESQGRCSLMLEALRYVKEAIGNEAFIVACLDQYPFSLACALMGIQEVMFQLVDQGAMVESLMEKCVAYATAYGRALAEAGADMLSGGDSPVGLLGPTMYRRFALPYERRLIGELKSGLSIPISLHICGDATPILTDMASSEADVLELDHRVDIAAACGILGPEIGIWGNLDPVGLLVRGNPDQVRSETRRLLHTVEECGHKRFVVSSGCTLAMETPSENIESLLDTTRNFAAS